MRKRKVALFMAAILTLTSVYPGGIVSAEDIVVEETAIEAPAEESSGENSQTAEVSVEDSLVVEEVPAVDAPEIAEPTDVQVEEPAGAVSEETAAASEVPVVELSDPVEVPEETAGETPAEELPDPAEVPEETAGETPAEELPDPAEVSEETAGETPVEELSDPAEVPEETTAGEAPTEELLDSTEVPEETTAGEAPTEELPDSTEAPEETIDEVPVEELTDPAVMPEELPNDTETEESEEIFEEVADDEETMLDADILEGDVTPAELIGEDGDFIVDVAAVNDIEPMSEMETESGDYAPELDLDAAEEIVPGSYKVTLSKGESKLFKFTPTEGGRYYIYSEGDEDTYVTLYGADGRKLSYSDDERGGNFCLYYDLEPSVTYYYEVREYDYYAAEFDIILSRTKAMVSARINAADSYEPFAMKREIYEAQVEIAYEDGTMSEKMVWETDYYYDEVSSESANVLFYRTLNGESVYLTLWTKDGLLIDMPEGRLPMPGSYTLKAIVDGQVCDSKEISIVEPKIEKTLSLGVESYELGTDMHKWYSFTPDVGGQYVIKNNGGYTWVYQAGYQSYLYRVYPEVNSLYEFEGGKEYLIVVSADSESPASGSIVIENRKTLSSVKLNADAFYDAGTFGKSVWSTLVEVGYNEAAETETVDSWGDDYRSFGDDVNLHYVACTYTDNGDRLYLSLWSGDQVIDLPWYSAGNQIPIGDFTLKVSAFENPDICDTAEIHIGGPETAVSLEEGVKTGYSLKTDSSIWYKFTAKETGEYRIENYTTGTSGTVARTYILENGYLNPLQSYDSNDYPLEMEAGKEYFFVILKKSAESTEGYLKVSERRAIASAEIVAENAYNLKTAQTALRNVQATISYAGSEPLEETIRSWEWGYYYDENYEDFAALYRKTENGNEVYLTLWTPDGQLTSMPLNDGYSSDFKEGSYYLKLMVDGVEKVSQPVTFILPATGELLDSCTLAAGEEKQVSIPVQKDTILKMKLEIESDTNNGEDEVFVVLYKENDGTLIYEDETDLYDNREKLLYLDAGESYRLVLTNYNSGSVTVNLFLAEKLEFESVTGFILGSATELDAVAVLQAVLDKMKVNYTDGSFENYLSWWKGSFGNEGEYSNWGVTTANGNVLELRLRKSDGTYASVSASDLDDGGVIKAGSYTTELYVDGIEQTDCQQSFTVAAADVNAFEELKPDTDIWVKLEQGESKWFRFTPQTTGEYTLYSEGSDTCAGLYNSDIEFLLEDDDGADGTNFSLTYQLEAGRTYYYKVFGYSKSAAEFTVTLTTRRTLISVKEGDKPSQTSFRQGDYIYLDLTMIFVYHDGSEKSFGLSDEDKFGNSIRAWMYPIDASGKADMTKEYPLSSEREPGKYLVVVKAYSEENYNTYEGDNFATMEIEITITEPDHEHVYEWVTESSPTCTEAGLKVHRCTICNFVDDDEEIPAIGHTWSGWKKVAEATTSEAEKQERTCSVCGATETKSVGDPLPAETEKPVTPPETEKPVTPPETEKPATPPETEKPSTPPETEKPVTPPETEKPATPPETEKPVTPPETEKPVTPQETEKPVTPPETENPEPSVTDPKLEVPADSVKMQKGQATTAFNVTMSEGDSIVSVVSSNKKILKVSKINKAEGTFKLKAKKKTGKVKLTITLASGATKTVTINVQKKKVTTTKVELESKKLSLKKGATYTLEPKVTPVTSQDKVKYKSSNNKVATVSAKGVVKAKKKGKATITVISGKKKVKCKVTVK